MDGGDKPGQRVLENGRLDILERLWGGHIVAAHGEVFEPALLPALIAGDREGLLTYRLDPPAAEIVTINALEPRQGIGTALVNALAPISPPISLAAASARSASRRPTIISTRCAFISAAGFALPRCVQARSKTRAA